MEMVFVPGGEFQMGSSDGSFAENPVHTVALDGFWLDRTEVTNAQYRRCAAAGMCFGPWYEDDSNYSDDNQPVVGVEWRNAQTFCQWAGARLPTEAEWEYAARGLESLLYPWGNTFEGDRYNYCDRNCQLEWADRSGDDGYNQAAPVGTFPQGASWVGALDKAGNVWEWVADWYDRGYYSRWPEGSPTGPAPGSGRVLRGGSWMNTSDIIRGAYRLEFSPVESNIDLGFRCARDS